MIKLSFEILNRISDVFFFNVKPENAYHCFQVYHKNMKNNLQILKLKTFGHGCTPGQSLNGHRTSHQHLDGWHPTRTTVATCRHNRGTSICWNQALPFYCCKPPDKKGRHHNHQTLWAQLLNHFYVKHLIIYHFVYKNYSKILPLWKRNAV